MHFRILTVLVLTFLTQVSHSADLISLSGVLTTGMTNVVQIRANKLEVGVMHQKTDLSLILVDPTGQTYSAPGSLVPTNMEIVANVPAGNVLISAIKVQNPMPGQWLIILNADPGAAPSYMLSAVTKGDRLNLEVAAEPKLQLKGKPELITGKVISDNGVKYKTLHAIVKLPNNTMEDVILQPTGEAGIFTGWFVNTKKQGGYKVVLQTDAGGDSTVDNFTVGDPSNIQLTGKIREFLNNEGNFNSIALEFGVTATNRGTYILEGALQDRQGRSYPAKLRASLPDYNEKHPYTNLVLRFYTPDMAKNLQDGIFTLSSLTMLREGQTGYELQFEMTNVWSTSNYKLNDFEPLDFNLPHQPNISPYRPKRATESWAQWYLTVLYPLHVQSRLLDQPTFFTFSRLQGEGSYVFTYLIHADNKLYLIGSSDDDSTLFKDVVLRIIGIQTDEIHPSGIQHTRLYSKVNLTSFDVPTDINRLSLVFPTLNSGAEIRVIEESDLADQLDRFYRKSQ